MKFAVVVLTFMLVFTGSFWAGEEDSVPDDIDSLFEEEDTTANGNSQQNSEDLLKDVVMGTGITLGADYFLLAGYSPGLNALPGDVADLSEIHYDDLYILDMVSSLSLNIRFSPELRVFNKITARFTDLVPEVEVTELFADYNLADVVFLRVGRQHITWGISRIYPFANLLARLPDSIPENEVTADSFAAKINIPLGTGGIETVLFTREIFWAPDTPEIADIGVGGRINLAFDFLDFTLGGFYHRDLNPRFFYTAKTTFFGTVEAYTEGVLMINPEEEQFGFSANAGIYFDLFSRLLQINTEYFYNGEKTELEVKGEHFPLFPGHNVALNLALSLLERKFKILLQGRYNISENSGLIIPAVTLNVFPNLTFSLSLPFVVGPTTSVYFDNPDNDNRRICLVFAVMLKGKL